MNSVSIHTASPTVNTRTDHVANKAIKPKVVKLNRKTLGLHVDKSVEHLQAKDESSSSSNGRTQKVTAHSYGMHVDSVYGFQ